MFLIFAESDTQITQLIGIIVSGICSIIGAGVAGYIAIIQAKEKAKAQARYEDATQRRDALSTKLDTVHAQIQPLIDKESALMMPAVPDDPKTKGSK